MLSDVLRSRQAGQVLNPVVHWVAVDVVHDAPAWYGPVCQLPCDDRTRSPHVRFGDFDPRPPVAPALPNRHGPHRHPVVGWDCAELGASRSALSLLGCFQVACATRRAAVGAVVDSLPLGGLSVELASTHGAGELRGSGAWATERRPVVATALRRAEQLARLVPSQAVGLHDHDRAATATRSFHMSSVAGTTLAVAERIGMFLTVTDTTEVVA